MLTRYCQEPEAGRELLKQMAANAKSLAKPESAAEVASICARAMNLELRDVA